MRACTAFCGTCITRRCRDVQPEFPISATYRNTAPAPTSPWVASGDYTVVLTVDGKGFTQPITVQMDPRVKTSAADLQEQFDLSWQLYQLRLTLGPVGKKFDDINEQLTKLKARAAERPDVTEKLEAFVQALAQFGPPHPRPGAPPSLFVLESTERLFNEIQGADAAPTAAVKAAVADVREKSWAVNASVAETTRHRSPSIKSTTQTGWIFRDQTGLGSTPRDN